MAKFLGLDYVTPLTINSRQKVYRSETNNLKFQTVSNEAQRWEAIITLAPSSNREAAPAGAKLSVHRTVVNTTQSFTAEMPQHIGTDIVASGGLVFSPVTTALAVNTAKGSIAASVHSKSTVTIPAGRFFTFNGHSKVYQVVEALDLVAGATAGVYGASGNLKFYPPLLKNEFSTFIDLHSPNIKAFYNNDGVEGVTYTDGILTRAVIDLIEDVNV